MHGGRALIKHVCACMCVHSGRIEHAHGALALIEANVQFDSQSRTGMFKAILHLRAYVCVGVNTYHKVAVSVRLLHRDSQYALG